MSVMNETLKEFPPTLERIKTSWKILEIVLILLVPLFVILNLPFVAATSMAIALFGIVFFDYLLIEERSLGVRELLSDIRTQKYSILFVVLLQLVIFLIVNHYMLEPSPLNLQEFVGGYIWIILLGPCLEEMCFRFGLQERLHEHTSERNAIIIASVTFAVFHWVWMALQFLIVEFVAHFLRSLVYGYIYSKTRHLLPPLIAHVGVNSIAVILSLM